MSSFLCRYSALFMSVCVCYVYQYTFKIKFKLLERNNELTTGILYYATSIKTVSNNDFQAFSTDCVISVYAIS